MAKILFIADHRPNRSPSQRFRFEQYLKYFEEHGHTCQYSWLLNEGDDQIFYSPKLYWKKAQILRKAWRKRKNDLRQLDQYDIVFIQREAIMAGTTKLEKKFASGKAKMIFDFDDAIWKLDISDVNKKFGFLKNPAKTSKIISYAHHVIAGNDFLAHYAEQFNPNVTVIPTTIDTSYHQPKEKKPNNCVTIGWTGSHTTLKHFRLAEPVLLELKKKYGEKIKFKLIGERNYSNAELDLSGTEWKAATEIEDLSEIDIGIMPLPDDEWSKGKCGFKGLQYMAMEIPPVMSSVGMNTEIVSHGVNGFLAGSNDEWLTHLSALIEQPELRTRIGKAARQTIIDKYSVHSQQERYLNVFKEVLKN